MRPFISEPAGSAATDDLTGIALDALWPNHLTSEELFAALHTPAHQHHFGAYQLFLHSRLPQEIDRADPLPAIEWLGETAWAPS